VFIAPVILGRTGRISFYALASAMVVLVVIYSSILAMGDAGLGADVGSYEFDQGKVSIPNGRYGRLGQADLMVYLESCNSHQYFDVSASAVETIRPLTPKQLPNGPSLIDALFRRKPLFLGYHPRC
jgi:hypothetical protein